MKEHIVAKVFLENEEGKILLLRRSKTAPRRPLEWDLPGGWVDKGEDPATSALRELKEEAGIAAINVKTEFIDERDIDDKRVKWHYFSAEAKNPTVRIGDEHDQFTWVDSADFTDYVKYEPQVEAFKRIYG